MWKPKKKKVECIETESRSVVMRSEEDEERGRYRSRVQNCVCVG
jgi:hypothetical protein